MIHQRIKIWTCENNSNISGDATLTTYIHDNTPEIDINRTRAAILVCPGGRYGFVSHREEEPVAIEFLSAGFNVFTLRYDVAPKSRHPQPPSDVS